MILATPAALVAPAALVVPVTVRPPPRPSPYAPRPRTRSPVRSSHDD
ncbi:MULTISPECIES: hypothetical protein [unclassified Streptomyces]|nr:MULTISPECIES: hypothetical protein [unclassified Streptomyces]